MNNIEDDNAIERMFEEFEFEQEEFWESLSKDEQLKVFASVIRRLSKAELIENKSYRGVLYDTFGFDFESYMIAQDAGFVALHNAIHPNGYVYDVLLNFCKRFDIGNAKGKIDTYLKGLYM